MHRLASVALLLSLLFSPLSIGAESVICSMPEMFSQQAMEHSDVEPMDEAHACCPMPETSPPCDINGVGIAITCCDAVPLACTRQVGIKPAERVGAPHRLLFSGAASLLTSLSVTSTLTGKFSSQPHYLQDPSPPLHHLLCTYII